jgi:hypothetical protein
MGRRKKFRPGDVVWFEREATNDRQYGVVVDYYRPDGIGEAGTYVVVPTTSQWHQARVYGGSLRLRSNLLHSAEVDHQMHTIVSRYRNNNALGQRDRGCYCHCCIHVSIPPSVVTPDGEFKEEE